MWSWKSHCVQYFLSTADVQSDQGMALYSCSNQNDPHRSFISKLWQESPHCYHLTGLRPFILPHIRCLVGNGGGNYQRAWGLGTIWPNFDWALPFQKPVDFNFLIHKQCQNEHIWVLVGIVLISLDPFFLKDFIWRGESEGAWAGMGGLQGERRGPPLSLEPNSGLNPITWDHAWLELKPRVKRLTNWVPGPVFNTNMGYAVKYYIPTKVKVPVLN